MPCGVVLRCVVAFLRPVSCPRALRRVGLGGRAAAVPVQASHAGQRAHVYPTHPRVQPPHRQGAAAAFGGGRRHKARDEEIRARCVAGRALLLMRHRPPPKATCPFRSERTSTACSTGRSRTTAPTGVPPAAALGPTESRTVHPLSSVSAAGQTSLSGTRQRANCQRDAVAASDGGGRSGGVGSSGAAPAMA